MRMCWIGHKVNFIHRCPCGSFDPYSRHILPKSNQSLSEIPTLASNSKIDGWSLICPKTRLTFRVLNFLSEFSSILNQGRIISLDLYAALLSFILVLFLTQKNSRAFWGFRARKTKSGWGIFLTPKLYANWDMFRWLWPLTTTLSKCTQLK